MNGLGVSPTNDFLTSRSSKSSRHHRKKDSTNSRMIPMVASSQFNSDQEELDPVKSMQMMLKKERLDAEAVHEGVRRHHKTQKKMAVAQTNVISIAGDQLDQTDEIKQTNEPKQPDESNLPKEVKVIDQTDDLNLPKEANQVKEEIDIEGSIIDSDDSDDEDVVPIEHLVQNHETHIPSESMYDWVARFALNTCCGDLSCLNSFFPSKDAKGKRQYKMAAF